MNPPANRPAARIHCRFTSDTLLLLLACGQMAGLQLSMNRYHQEAVDGREKILALEHKNEVAIASHIKIAVERWRAMQEANPQLTTPQIPETPP